MAEELTPLDAIEEPTWRALARFFVVAPRLLTALTQAYPVHLRSVRARVLDHVYRSTLPCFARAVIAIAESLG